MIRYGAKSLPYGGWWAVPPLAGDGWMIIGDSAGLLNSQRLKGIHLAIKSGMLQRNCFRSLETNDSSATTLGRLQSESNRAGSKRNSGRSANFHQCFEHGIWWGLINADWANAHRRSADLKGPVRLDSWL